MKKKCLISIITPTYNQGKFIEDCILSIKNQTYINIEHIIIDAQSTDNTLDIIKKHENSYNMKWISEKDDGQADAIRKGFAIAKGDVLAWLNSDDYYMNKKVIEEVVEIFENYNDVDVVTGNGYYVDKNKRHIAPIFIEEKKITKKHMKRADYILQPATFVKRVVSEKSYIDTKYKYVFDWIYFLRMFEIQANFLYTNKCFAAYRMYDENKTGLDNAERKLEIAKVVNLSFGVFSLQTIYCYFIYYLYIFAELFGKSIERKIKKVINVIGSIIRKLSNGMLYSC